ncbi:hypothetical protein AGMMS49992_06780 [Clostridia bacterium]|nr:hypothetical protein AGMMS49992_06780 [Clostridia bacterium]
MFSRFAKISAPTWGVLIALILIGAGVMVLARGRKELRSPRILAIGALCVALAFVLHCVKLFSMPQGGSVTPASMLPILAFAYYFGLAPGVLAGVAFGLLNLLYSPDILSFWQVMLDYPIAFGILGLAALFRGWRDDGGFLVGILVGVVGRFICAILAGVVFWYEYAGAQNPLIYSIIYNGSYLLPEMIICVAVAAIPGVRSMLKRIATV